MRMLGSEKAQTNLQSSEAQLCAAIPPFLSSGFSKENRMSSISSDSFVFDRVLVRSESSFMWISVFRNKENLYIHWRSSCPEIMVSFSLFSFVVFFLS